MQKVIEKAFAKINLFLHVRHQRPDGYHALESLFVFADLADNITLTPTPTNSDVVVRLTGPFAGSLVKESSSNLVVQAATIFRQHYNVSAGVIIDLVKNIPVAAGLGGGSADAAAALRGLHRLWGGSASRAPLATLALSLGSDVPACLAAETVFVEGRGEILTPCPLFPKNLPAVLINPGIALATADVFSLTRASGFRQDNGVFTASPATLSASDWQAILPKTRNDLQPAASSLLPEIIPILDALAAHQPVHSGLSGSGATCFALMPSRNQAERLAHSLRKAFPTAWVVCTVANPTSR